jgi:L-asparaginase II
MISPPLLVEVTRGGNVESVHRGHAVVTDADGRTIAAWGEPDRLAFPRSALKPVQALPLVETGAAAAFGLGSEELALATASHSGEPMHTERVAAWLARLTLSAADLECGAHAPAGEAVRGPWNPLHNNCSGKHAGFLTVARHLGVPSRGYIDRAHPVQQLVTAAIHDLTDTRPETTPAGIDGCGIPTFALPLTALATAMARLATPKVLDGARADAARAIVAAMRRHPELVAGSGRLCSEIMRNIPDIAVKGGAEGCYTAIIPAQGWGIALKIEDGAKRGAEVAILAVLRRIGVLAADALPDWQEQALVNAAGKRVGVVRSSP